MSYINLMSRIAHNMASVVIKETTGLELSPFSASREMTQLVTQYLTKPTTSDTMLSEMLTKVNVSKELGTPESKTFELYLRVLKITIDELSELS